MPSSTTTARGGRPLPDADLPVAPLPSSQPPSPSSGRRGLGGTESLATGCALVVCLVAQLPHRVLDATGIRAWGLALVVAVAVVSGVRALARMPLTLVRSLREEPSRGTALRRWARQELTIATVSVVAGAALTLPLYALLRATPAWWLPASILFAGLTVLWQLMLPFVMGAQAGPLTAAGDTDDRRLRALAARAGVEVPGGVAVAGKPGSRRCNAYVVGLGPTRRVVLEQGVAAWPAELVDQVVAHELGHLRLAHNARRLPLTLLAQLGTLAAAAAALSVQPLLDWVEQRLTVGPDGRHLLHPSETRPAPGGHHHQSHRHRAHLPMAA
ncbi:MAG: M48 family metalloprotease, partial [Acidimicrobiales bacterium]